LLAFILESLTAKPDHDNDISHYPTIGGIIVAIIRCYLALGARENGRPSLPGLYSTL
jgi:hypothetical protein